MFSVNNHFFFEVNELDFLSKFKEDKLDCFHTFFDALDHKINSIFLLDNHQQLFAKLDFYPERTPSQISCSFFASKENRSELNWKDPSFDISECAFSELSLLYTDIDFLIEEFENTLKKEDFQDKQENIDSKSISMSYDKISNLHSNTQFIIKKIGEIVDYKTWIAFNDKSRLANGKELGIDTLKKFPEFNVAPRTLNTLKLIDAIWFEGNRPTHCFEVETSTSIYSAFLRFSDLSLSLPHYEINYFILIPRQRITKALNELSRPSIQSLGVSDFIRVIFIEDLEIMFQKINGLHGYIYPNILDKISYNVEELEFYHSTINGGVHHV